MEEKKRGRGRPAGSKGKTSMKIKDFKIKEEKKAIVVTDDIKAEVAKQLDVNERHELTPLSTPDKDPILTEGNSNINAEFDGGDDKFDSSFKEIQLDLGTLNAENIGKVDSVQFAPGKEPHKLLGYLTYGKKISDSLSILNISHDKSFESILKYNQSDVISTTELDLNLIANKFDVIIIDVDPHDGNFERNAFKKCKMINYKGIIIYDDTLLNNNMKTFWAELPEDIKIDVTKYGHWSGTGIVNLNPNIKFILK